MKKLLIFLFFISFYGNSQEFRSYVDNANEADKICAAYAGKGFYSDKTAEEALDKILSTIGASKRFVLSACENIPTAMAISLKGIRYIFYNREFMSQINSYTNYWSNMSILAHEIGHHINGHTTDAILILNDVVDVESLSESRKMELEADEFAGFVLAKLDATLAQATEAIALISSNEDDTYSTHPSKSKRLAAIRRGYDNGAGKKVGEITTNYKKTSSSTVNEYFYSGVEKFDKKDYSGAIASFTKAIELVPHFATAYNYRGVVKMLLKDYYGAIADYNKAIELRPNFAVAYNNRGDSKRKLKDYYGAIADLTKAIELDPNDALAYSNRAFAKMLLEDFEDAIEDYTKAIELDPSNAIVYSGRSWVKMFLSDFNGAIADLTKAIELDPDYETAYYNRAVIKEATGDNNGACEDYRISASMGNTSVQELIRKNCN